jgi:hypothetical protein
MEPEMPTLIKSKQAQRKILGALYKLLKKRFSENFERGAYDCLRKYKGHKEFADFGLDFWMRHDWVGISIWGPSIGITEVEKNVLGFATYSQKSQAGTTAAAFARDERGIALYHDGRVFAPDRRARPRLHKPMTEIKGHEYYKIAYVDDIQFFEYVMEYHFSRVAADESDDAINDIGSDTASRVNSSGTRYFRDQRIREAVIRRAEGKCEFCGELGFLCEGGIHYLECHHIIALANEGADRMTNGIRPVAAALRISASDKTL